MKKTILGFSILLLLGCPLSFAGQNEWEGRPFTYSDEYSQKIFHETFVDIPDGMVVYASSFYQEGFPDRHIFRETMTGVVFYNCNLDNVFVAEGNTIIGGTHRNIQVQEDGKDWVVDADGDPVEKL